MEKQVWSSTSFLEMWGLSKKREMKSWGTTLEKWLTGEEGKWRSMKWPPKKTLSSLSTKRLSRFFTTTIPGSSDSLEKRGLLPLSTTSQHQPMGCKTELRVSFSPATIWASQNRRFKMPWPRWNQQNPPSITWCNTRHHMLQNLEQQPVWGQAHNSLPFLEPGSQGLGLDFLKENWIILEIKAKRETSR